MFCPKIFSTYNCLHLPCLLDRMGVTSEADRARLKSRYVGLKRASLSGGISGIVVYQAYLFAKDAMTCKLKKRGYKWLVCWAPAITTNIHCTLLYSVFSGTKIARFAISLATLSSELTKLQLETANLGVMGLDLLLFGELVPLFPSPISLSLVRNQTSAVEQIVEDLIP